MAPERRGDGVLEAASFSVAASARSVFGLAGLKHRVVIPSMSFSITSSCSPSQGVCHLGQEKVKVRWQSPGLGHYKRLIISLKAGFSAAPLGWSVSTLVSQDAGDPGTSLLDLTSWRSALWLSWRG